MVGCWLDLHAHADSKSEMPLDTRASQVQHDHLPFMLLTDITDCRVDTIISIRHHTVSAQ